jgi:hypothetical protein
MKPYFFCTLICLALLSSGCYYDSGDALGVLLDDFCNPLQVSYALEVLPLFEDNCYSCHSGASPSAGLNMEGFANTKVIIDDGSLLSSLKGEDGYEIMPPGSTPLADCNIATIETWILEGANNN